MIGIFKQKSPGNIFLLLIFGLLVKLPLFMYSKNIASTELDGELFESLIEWLPAENAFYAALLAFFLLYIQSLMINHLVNEYRMTPRPHYLPAMAYLLITSLMPEWTQLSAPLLASTFVIAMFIKLFGLYNTASAKQQVFNIGLLAGLSSYIYFPSASFVLCILVGLMILKPFRLNEIILFLFGCLTPYYFHAVYLFLTDNLSLDNFLPSLDVRVPIMKSSFWLAASTLLLTIPFLLGGYFIQLNLGKMLIQVRKNWSIMLLYLLLAFFVPFVNSNQSFHAWVLLMAPFSAFHASAYFFQKRHLISYILFYITLGYVFYIQYGTPTWH
ncbi:MAG: hypothetical protein H0U44_12095 [Flavisolibacter sp.]|nr:hypothetical protein [Flavisolibacter sp.]